MNMEEYIIRKATGSDLDAIMEIETDSFTVNNDNFSRRELKYLIEKSKVGCFVLEMGGEVLAYTSLLARVNASNLRIYSLAVHSKARGKKLGEALLNFGIQYAKENGFASATLEVKVNNKPAISLYQKNGFETFSIKENYYHDGSNAFCMRRRME